VNYQNLVLGTLYPGQTQQERAMSYFFSEAFTLGQQNISLIPLSELRGKRRYYLKMAKQLRGDSAEQERFGLYEHRRMIEAALAYEKLAGPLVPAAGRSSLVVTRQPRADGRLKGFVVLLSEINKNVFGSPLYGSIATTANVVFCRNDIKSGTVRKVLSTHPALKAP
jgi:hypothetical protein